jgi:CheY-like chemotaxis protein
MLERAGHVVLEARNGVHAVSEFADVDVDVLLTDVVLPGGLTGPDVADRLRRQRPHLPVVYMSGYSADLLAERGIDGDAADAVLQKPFTEAELLAAVDGVMVGASR